jgi:hypothetical protein
MTGEINGPQRAYTLTLRIGADTIKDLAHTLSNMAWQAEAGELTRGSFGSPCSGGEYELLEIDKPHAKYFEELHAYLAERKAEREAASPSGGAR